MLNYQDIKKIYLEINSTEDLATVTFGVIDDFLMENH